jgi:tryptophanase
MLDNFFYFQHGGNAVPGGSTGRRVWAIGNKKDASTSALTSSEQFRIQRYDTNTGEYSGNVMTANTQGVVQFPGGHARTVEAKAAGDPIPADTAATIGVVADMILTALVRLDLIPRTRVADVAGVVGVALAEASNEYDPTSARDEELT